MLTETTLTIFVTCIEGQVSVCVGGQEGRKDIIIALAQQQNNCANTHVHALSLSGTYSCTHIHTHTRTRTRVYECACVCGREGQKLIVCTCVCGEGGGLYLLDFIASSRALRHCVFAPCAPVELKHPRLNRKGRTPFTKPYTIHVKSDPEKLPEAICITAAPYVCIRLIDFCGALQMTT